MKRLLILLFLAIVLLALSCNEDDGFLDSINSAKYIAKNDSSKINLNYQDAVLLNDELIIQFSGVTADSRCPMDVMCFWAGDGEIKLKLKTKEMEKDISLHTTLYPKAVLVDNYLIELISLNPYPKSSRQIRAEEYSIELKIKYASSGEIRTVQMIDLGNEWMLKKNPFAVNEVSIDKNILTMSLSYSGGCKEHYIEMYAYTGILKSNPPQLNMVLSHEANNDMCEAYLTKKIQFDLSKVKEYLNFGSYTSGKIILNIFDPTGNAIKQSPVTYNY